jgi:hypothetical protein
MNIPASVVRLLQFMAIGQRQTSRRRSNSIPIATPASAAAMPLVTVFAAVRAMPRSLIRAWPLPGATISAIATLPLIVR